MLLRVGALYILLLRLGFSDLARGSGGEDALTAGEEDDEGISSTAARSLDPLSYVDIWPMPRSVHGGTSAARVDPGDFRITMFGLNSSSTVGRGCGTLAAEAVRRLRRTLFMAEPTTSAYRPASLLPVSEGLTMLEQLVRDAQHAGPLPTFKVLHVLKPTSWTDSMTAEDLIEASESYTLELGLHGGKLEADTEVGLLRGLETFSQLVRWLGRATGYAIGPLPLVVKDAPRFAWRGFMVDTSRHYLPVGHIFRTLDGMAAMKLNVFHWHMTDAQSFPYQSNVFPLLAKKGAFTPDAVYTRDQIKEVVAYALGRGIRVVAEFDLPAHSASWGKGHPELTAPCEGLLRTALRAGDAGGFVTKLNKVAFRPMGNATWEFLDKFFREVLETFPDVYVHLGMDEVNGECWAEGDKDVKAFAENPPRRRTARALLDDGAAAPADDGVRAAAAAAQVHNILDTHPKTTSSGGGGRGHSRAARSIPFHAHANGHSEHSGSSGSSHIGTHNSPGKGQWVTALESQFRRRLEALVRAAAREMPGRKRPVRFVSWESDTLGGVDVLDDDGDGGDRHGGASLGQTWRNDRSDRTRALHSAGWQTLQSEHWYLDHLNDKFRHFYERTVPNSGSVVGGEACTWGLSENEANYFPRVFNRLPAAAERLWSAASVSNLAAAEKRVSVFYCHALRWRGIPAGPLYPDHCDVPAAARAAVAVMEASSATLAAAEADFSRYAHVDSAALRAAFDVLLD